MDIADKLIHQVASDRNIRTSCYHRIGSRFLLMNVFLPSLSLFLPSISLSSRAGLGWGGGGTALNGFVSTGSAPGVHVTLTVKVMSVDL